MVKGIVCSKWRSSRLIRKVSFWMRCRWISDLLGLRLNFFMRGFRRHWDFRHRLWIRLSGSHFKLTPVNGLVSLFSSKSLLNTASTIKTFSMDSVTWLRDSIFYKEGSKMASLTNSVSSMINKWVIFLFMWDKIIYGTFKNGDIRTINVLTDNEDDARK